jgi:hypothetical protein
LYPHSFQQSTPHPIFPGCHSTLFLLAKFHKNQNKKEEIKVYWKFQLPKEKKEK